MLARSNTPNTKTQYFSFIFFTLFMCFCSGLVLSENEDTLQRADSNIIQSDSIGVIQSDADRVDFIQPNEISSNNEFNISNNKSNGNADKSNNTDWSNNISWIVVIIGAILGAMVAYFHIDHISRPVITILIMKNGSKVNETKPRIENTSKTDAEGTVILRLLIDDMVYQCDKNGTGAYSGERIWYFPATNKEMQGSINLKTRIEEIEKLDENLKGKNIYLESCLHYRRFYPYATKIRKLILRTFYCKIFSSPIQRWQLINDEWVLIPDFELPQKPYDFNKNIFKSDSEVKNIRS